MSSWTKQQVMTLISLYKKHTCLYVAGTEKFKSKYARNEAMNQVMEELLPMRPGSTINEIKIKFNSLRSTYVQEKRKILNSMNSATRSEEVYVPSLFYYNHMDNLCRNGVGVGPKCEPVDPIATDSESLQEKRVLTLDDAHMRLLLENENTSPSPSHISYESAGSGTGSQSVEPEEIMVPSTSKRPAKGKSKKSRSSDDVALEAAAKAMEQIASVYSEVFVKAKKPEADYIDTFVKYISMKIRRIDDEEIVNDVIEQIETNVNDAMKRCREKKRCT